MTQSDGPAAALEEWVAIDSDAAVLRRFILSNGQRGLLLQFTGLAKAPTVRERALGFGFKQAGTSQVLKLVLKPGDPYPAPSRLASSLGGRVIRLPRKELNAAPWTIDYTTRANVYGEPDYATMESIGLNAMGEEVFRDRRRRYRKLLHRRGSVFRSEQKDDPGPLFLRAKTEADLEPIAAGLVHLAERRAIDPSDIDRVIDASLESIEPTPCGTRKRARHRLLLHIYTQITAITLEDGGSRKNFHRSMRIAENAAPALNACSDEECFQPSTSLAVFLRRLTREATEVDFKGGDFLATVVPIVRQAESPSFQVHDLTNVPFGSLMERMANSLGRRTDDGRSLFLTYMPQGSPEETSLRQAIGKAYAFEVVAKIAPSVAEGRRDRSEVTLYIVGQKRPVSEENLPHAALRTFEVIGNGDLDNLYIEILRSRSRIQEWHDNLADIETLHSVDQRENVRQRPYVPLSRSTPSFTMLPKALEGATAKSLRRVASEFQKSGGVDATTAGWLGVDTGTLSHMLTSEQVDAVAMWHVARRRGRAFLLADQTGIGKGRCLAAIVRHHIRSGGKAIYFTENVEINIRDVWRDLLAVGADREARPTILAAKPVTLESTYPSEEENGSSRQYKTLSAYQRNEVFASGSWPDDSNLVLTTYTIFNGKRENGRRDWLGDAIDGSTLVVLDESHNAINPRSNTGKSIRAAISSAGAENVLFATATPMRNPAGADLYRPLLPQAEGDQLADVLESLGTGGETAQESFTTMLAEDGVFLRRDHDLSNVEYQIRFPSDERMSRYQELIEQMSAITELMLDISIGISAILGRHQGMVYRQMIMSGVDEATARMRTNAANQYSGIGGPIPRLARLMTNAIKVDQVADEAAREIEEGRKPLITFHSTSAGLLNEYAAKGALSESSQIGRGLSLSDQVRRVAKSVYRVKINEEVVDGRELDESIAQAADNLDELIGQIPSELVVSPVDAVIERLEARGISVGEISGRAYCFRGGRIRRRMNRDKRQTIDRFNDGEIDALIFNMAGATGGSYHAAPEFGDKRPRSLIEMETPTDIIKWELYT